MRRPTLPLLLVLVAACGPRKASDQARCGAGEILGVDESDETGTLPASVVLEAIEEAEDATDGVPLGDGRFLAAWSACEGESEKPTACRVGVVLLGRTGEIHNREELPLDGRQDPTLGVTLTGAWIVQADGDQALEALVGYQFLGPPEPGVGSATHEVRALYSIPDLKQAWIGDVSLGHEATAQDSCPGELQHQTCGDEHRMRHVMRCWPGTCWERYPDGVSTDASDKECPPIAETSTTYRWDPKADILHTHK
jgi:hypothetical protein